MDTKLAHIQSEDRVVTFPYNYRSPSQFAPDDEDGPWSGDAAATSESVLAAFINCIECSPHKSARQLMERILEKARAITGAEAGTIFVVRRNGNRRRLEAASLQNDVMQLEPAEFSIPVDATSIAGYVATTGETLIIDDLYALPADVPYGFNARFDRANGYRSRSMFCFPLTKHDGDVIGVVQLVNRRRRGVANPIPFTRLQKELILPFNHIVGAALERALMLERIIDQNAKLRERNRALKASRAQIEALQGETEEAFRQAITLLARAAEIHDPDTADHIARTNEYSYLLACKLGMSQAFCDEIAYSAQLHDVGKMSVNTAVLKKPGELTPDERAEIERHAEYGYKILSHSDRLNMGAEIALSHHEKWDGSGYPNGLEGESIPLSARIVAVADIYDALRARRVYKPEFSHEHAYSIMLNGDDRLDSTGHFDPRILAVFAEHHGEFDAIWRSFGD